MRRKKPQFLAVSQIKQIAREYGRTKGAAALAKEVGVSKRKVSQVVACLRRHGVDIPSMRVQRYSEIVTELRDENPELFAEVTAGVEYEE